MECLALATDYDGTIAQQGSVDLPTLRALRRLKASGRRLLLVTGRELPDLERVFPELHLFDGVVAENGALLYDPSTRREWLITHGPPPALVAALHQRGVEPLSVGRAILATWEPHERTALEVIAALGLNYQVILNKGAVMLLPVGIDKAAGLAALLAELELAFDRVVGVGDAENDRAFLRLCGCAAAVGNALPAVIQDAHVRLHGRQGAGVAELIDLICSNGVVTAPADGSQCQGVLGAS